MQRILFVIAPKDFRDEELLVPRQILTDAGFKVTTVSTQTGKATGMLGAEETITQSLDDITIADYDGVVVVGGMGSIEYLWPNTTLHAYLNDVYTRGGVVGGICLSGAVPALAGLTQSKRLTVWETPESRAAIEDNGGIFTGEACTIDGRLVTANGPEAAQQFGDALVSVLKAQPVNA